MSAAHQSIRTLQFTAMYRRRNIRMATFFKKRRRGAKRTRRSRSGATRRAHTLFPPRVVAAHDD
jgi:hypothetical protein